MMIGLVVAIAAGGAMGALVRYGAQLLWPARGARVPVAVLLVNVVGSAIGGVFLALAQWDSGGTFAVSSSLALIVMTGFCGGLTTFSTFSVETVELASAGSWRPAAANVVLNVILGLGGAALAFTVTYGVIIVTTGAFVG
ncbi:fluoride efflux transporter CrcB [Alpinimonas psychrophila]|uniref:Fluoride-specific ion channel FluC n=1 Tax=Alpinimonas psychrophila TaxID=748908 RepID=A0A7W3JUX7_9MICO|nr:CrcB family protein [Alpinimonas psychrophila]MBA8829689.1 CrcB protein [Alpinimonas psychrophila]